jgi:hypothetical protein
VSNLAGEDALHDICAVEAIHAVCAQHSTLSLQDFAIGLIDVLSVVKSAFKACLKASVLCQLRLDVLEQFRKVLPFHFLAFAVEVEPFISD